MIFQVLGVVLISFLPGFILTQIFFPEEEFKLKVLLSVIISICSNTMLGLFLGFSETMKDMTGGLSKSNLWIYTIILNAVLFGVLIFRKLKPKIKIGKTKEKRENDT
jgi:uncharacterized membrane protein